MALFYEYPTREQPYFMKTISWDCPLSDTSTYVGPLGKINTSCLATDKTRARYVAPLELLCASSNQRKRYL